MDKFEVIGFLATMCFISNGDSDTALFFAELLLLLSVNKKSEDK